MSSLQSPVCRKRAQNWTYRNCNEKVAQRSFPYFNIQHMRHILPVPENTYALPSGHVHPTVEAYKLLMTKPYVHADVPLGDKSDRFMFEDNPRNLSRIQNKKKCDFFNDCGIWEFSKGNTVKAIYIIGNDFLKYVERKDGKYCIRRPRKSSAASWEPLDLQPEERRVLIVGRYYATLKRDSNFKKRVSYFM